MNNYIDTNLDSIRLVPIINKRGIYFLYEGKELVYIGQSIHINKRIYGDHVGKKKVK